MVKIGHASLDERGDISGGKAGDQTGSEVCIRDWYAKGWTQVCRPKSKEVAEKIASAMEAACKNDLIGYDQNQRTTLYNEAKKVGWDLSKVKVACETDCSALVAVCCNAAGLSVSKDIYTGNEVAALKQTGAFTVLTAKKYLDSPDYLERGDVLVKQYAHTAVVLTNGSKAPQEAPQPTPEKPAEKPSTEKVQSAQSFSESLAGLYRVTTSLYLRTGAGKEYKDICVMPTGAKVRNYGYYTEVDGVKWLLVKYNDQTGFCSSKYLIYLREN